MDSVNIVRLLKVSHGESPIKLVADFDDQRVLEYVTTTLRHCFCVVAESSGRVLGSLALAPIRLPWSPTTLVLAEAWLAVIPQFRTKGVPEKLLAAAGVFLDRTQHAAFLGTSMVAPSAFDAIMEGLPDYAAVRTSFIRVPAPVSAQVQEAASA